MLQERGGGGQARRALAHNRTKISLLTKHGEGAVLLNRTLLVLAIKDNPRLCRGEKIAYGEGQSRQEKVSELE